MLPPSSTVIPAFNEPTRIGDTIRATLDYYSRASTESELSVINDGSTDATSTIARQALNPSGLPFWDTQCGFKAFRLDVCRPILEQARVIGFAFDVELLYLADRTGLRLREIPVRWNHHEGSKVRFVHDSLRMLREIVTLRTE